MLSQPASKAGSPGKGTELSVEEILESLKAPAGKTLLQAQEEREREFERVLATMEVPADLAGALNKEIAEWLKDDQDHRKPSPVIAALLYHWTTRDVAAMLKWAETDAATRDAMIWHCSQVYAKAIKDKGPGVLAAGLAVPSGAFFVAHELAVGLGLGEDPAAQALALKATLPEDQWLQVRRWFQERWGFQQKDMLAKVAIAEQQPEMLLNFAKKQGAEGMKWLRGLLADDSLDSGFREQVSNSAAWKDYVKNDATMPLAERMKLLGGDDEAKAGALYEQLVTKDLSAILKNGRDWRNAFRNGAANADEVLAAMEKEMPELAKQAPVALRDRLFMELVEEDPARAMELLDKVPEAEKAQIAMKAAVQAFGNIDPNLFLATLEKIPADTPELWDQRLEAWAGKSQSNHMRLEEDYVTWVRGLPPGLDREMALYSLAKAVQAKDGTLAAELRGELTDAKLKQRMEEGR
ncbi:hypothetical protein [Haloferula sp. BvORR071]|uniref:hypothetical protein n=1 Tax=Haloferula sp. BvORR071 TaxID=1396141 RepID=UPI002240FF3E|nr:hypothetical protein [Haloferula sp. BvORR071]